MERNQDSHLKDILKRTGKGLLGLTALSIGLGTCVVNTYACTQYPSLTDSLYYSAEPALLSTVWLTFSAGALYDFLRR